MENFEQFIGSFSFDNRLAQADIAGSIAHTRMLVKTKIISSSEGKKIISELNTISKDLKTTGFYKQNYCGCCYSLVEAWEEKFRG